MPLPVKLLSVPPMTVTSAKLKSVLVSLSVKLMVAVSPVARFALLLVTAMVGGLMSTGVPVPPVPVPVPVPVLLLMFSASALLGSLPSALLLPAASVKLPLLTSTTPLVTPVVGVKVAV